jgi:hypothetical protein
MAKHRDGNGEGGFFKMHVYMMKTVAWRALSAGARAVYLQIASRYNGSNNGRLALSVRSAASECNLAKETASRAFRELTELGFIEETRRGGLIRGVRISSEWRLTAFKCDLTGNLSPRTFMQRGAQAHAIREVRGRPQPGRREGGSPTALPVLNDGRACPKRRYTPSYLTVRASADCPKRRYRKADFEPSPVLNDGTHPVYHTHRGSTEATNASSRPPASPPADAAAQASGESWTAVAEGLEQRVLGCRNGKIVALSMIRLPAAEHRLAATPAPTTPSDADAKRWADDDREDAAAEQRSKWSGP